MVSNERFFLSITATCNVASAADRLLGVKYLLLLLLFLPVEVLPVGELEVLLLLLTLANSPGEARDLAMARPRVL